MADFDRARALLAEFKGEDYLCGLGVLPDVGSAIASVGRSAALVRGTFPDSDDWVRIINRSLARAGVELVAEIRGARPNAPREDLLRIAAALGSAAPDVVVSFGGGSTIDATKAGEILRSLGGAIDDYFGTDLVTRALKRTGRSLAPHVAIQSVASSAAHLTKYSNITDLETSQKKLIVDSAIVPARPVFDYEVTLSQPRSLTADGAMDGMSHLLEVLYGAVDEPDYCTIREVATTGLGLIVEYLPEALDNPENPTAREALCLGTDLGGYAIMLGGTSGGHLTSFSLVDVLSHGRACAIMNPYYTVFFAPAIQDPLRAVGEVLYDAGYASSGVRRYTGRDLGLTVAEAMLEFAHRIGFPTRLGEVEGFTDEHIDRALAAAKDPQLKMKLENMPVPLTAEMVDDYMGPILVAARDGTPSHIRNVRP
ncbi:MAG: iron-containing alcohol dehydrogenase [Anaerolineae bacterium]|jgi:alcohol dehydrogenase